MQMETDIRHELEASLRAFERLASQPVVDILIKIAHVWIQALRLGRKILFAGNGGSAADAQHLAAELVGRFAYDRPALPALALTTDTSVLTAIGNDYGFEQVFSRQIEALGVEGDVLVGISTSGTSPNVLRAMQMAQQKGLVTIGFSGQTGGDLLAFSDLIFRVPATETAHIQQCHLVGGHLLCRLVEQAIFPESLVKGKGEYEPFSLS